MRIVYCIPALSQPGGMERILTIKANFLANQPDHKVYIITTSQNNLPCFYELSPKIHRIDLNINYNKTQNNLILKLIDRVKKITLHKKRLKSILFKIKADIVISMFTHEMPFLPTIHDGSKKILEYHFSKEMNNIKLSQTNFFLHHLILKSWQDYIGSKIKLYDQFVLLTKNDAKAWGYSKNSCVIPNPVTISVNKRKTIPRKKIILSVGRLCHQKGFDLLLNIWRQIFLEYPEWKLEILGTGPDLNFLQGIIDKNGMSKSVSILPPTQKIIEKYLESSIFVATSRYEGFHLALLEAQCSGLPAISYNTPCGPAEIIEEGKSGFLIALNDDRTFIEKLKTLLDDKNLQSSFGEYAKKQISRKFELPKIMLKWEEIFRKLQQDTQKKEN